MPLAIGAIALVAAALVVCALWFSAEHHHESLFSAQGTVQAVAESTDESGALAGGVTRYDGYRKRILWFHRDGKRIYAELYMPEHVKNPELVVMCHGLGGSTSYVGPCAVDVALTGRAALIFDFCGGGLISRSDGEVEDMSIMTEVADLEAVLDQVANVRRLANSKVTLFGESQGGVVASIVAARHPESFQRLILFYPAFSLIDDLHTAFGSLEAVPDHIWFEHWLCLGRRYADDIWDFKFEDVIGAYTGPVLLVHGTADEIVDPSYSARAAACYGDAELRYINGAGHGFGGAAFEQAMNTVFDFLDAHS